MTRQLTLQAQVKDSTLQLSGDQRERMARFIAKHEDKFMTMTLRQSGKPRSISENNYYHGVVVDMIVQETKQDHESVHEFLRMKFLPRKLVELGDDAFMVATSTTQLNTLEFEDYLTDCRQWALDFLNITIPLPNQL